MKTKEAALWQKWNEFFLKVADGEMINLTDLWRLEGMPGEQDPDRWLKLPATTEFIEALQAHPTGQKSLLLRKVRGKYGGTFAHWQIAVAYAQYLSPELHHLVTSIYIEHLEETADPELGISRSEERAKKVWKVKGHDEEWIECRLKGIDKCSEFTATLGAHGVREEDYGSCTNGILLPILQVTAAEVKEKRNLPSKVNLRDTLEEFELIGIQLAEVLAKRNIK